MVRYLILEGLDPEARNDAGRTPLEVARGTEAHHTPGALRWYAGPGRYEWAYLLAISLLSAGLGAFVAKRRGYGRVIGAVLGATLLGLLATAVLPRRRGSAALDPSADPGSA